ncbi:MAG TPA: hypothetical protein EYP68_08420 [Candidatus Korarchaeota archaeon]|nr:hypothetical protein [Candidatus Korarchaeota archaeon]
MCRRVPGLLGVLLHDYEKAKESGHRHGRETDIEGLGGITSHMEGVDKAIVRYHSLKWHQLRSVPRDYLHFVKRVKLADCLASSLRGREEESGKDYRRIPLLYFHERWLRVGEFFDPGELIDPSSRGPEALLEQYLSTTIDEKGRLPIFSCFSDDTTNKFSCLTDHLILTAAFYDLISHVMAEEPSLRFYLVRVSASPLLYQGLLHIADIEGIAPLFSSICDKMEKELGLRFRRIITADEERLYLLREDELGKVSDYLVAKLLPIIASEPAELVLKRSGGYWMLESDFREAYRNLMTPKIGYSQSWEALRDITPCVCCGLASGGRDEYTGEVLCELHMRRRRLGRMKLKGREVVLGKAGLKDFFESRKEISISIATWDIEGMMKELEESLRKRPPALLEYITLLSDAAKINRVLRSYIEAKGGISIYVGSRRGAFIIPPTMRYSPVQEYLRRERGYGMYMRTKRWVRVESATIRSSSIPDFLAFVM